MKFRFAHNCLFVQDLERSLAFYKEALGLEPVRTMHPSDMDATLVFLSDGESAHELEIGYVPARKEPYSQGDNEFHIAFSVGSSERYMPSSDTSVLPMLVSSTQSLSVPPALSRVPRLEDMTSLITISGTAGATA